MFYSYANQSDTLLPAVALSKKTQATRLFCYFLFKFTLFIFSFSVVFAHLTASVLHVCLFMHIHAPYIPAYILISPAWRYRLFFHHSSFSSLASSSLFFPSSFDCCSLNSVVHIKALRSLKSLCPGCLNYYNNEAEEAQQYFRALVLCLLMLSKQTITWLVSFLCCDHRKPYMDSTLTTLQLSAFSHFCLCRLQLYESKDCNFPVSGNKHNSLLHMCLHIHINTQNVNMLCIQLILLSKGAPYYICIGKD